jgi:hypothetical protein
MPGSSDWSLFFMLPHQNSIQIFLLPHISFLLLDHLNSIYWYLVTTRIHEAPQYAVFFCRRLLLSLKPKTLQEWKRQSTNVRFGGENHGDIYIYITRHCSSKTVNQASSPESFMTTFAEKVCSYMKWDFAMSQHPSHLMCGIFLSSQPTCFYKGVIFNHLKAFKAKQWHCRTDNKHFQQCLQVWETQNAGVSFRGTYSQRA